MNIVLFEAVTVLTVLLVQASKTRGQVHIFWEFEFVYIHAC